MPGADRQFHETGAGDLEGLDLGAIGAIGSIRATGGGDSQQPAFSRQGPQTLGAADMASDFVKLAAPLGEAHEVEAGNAGGEDQLGIRRSIGLIVGHGGEQLAIGGKGRSGDWLHR